MVFPWLAKRWVCPHGNYEHLTTVGKRGVCPPEIAGPVHLENEGGCPPEIATSVPWKTRGLSLSGKRVVCPPEIAGPVPHGKRGVCPLVGAE